MADRAVVTLHSGGEPISPLRWVPSEVLRFECGPTPAVKRAGRWTSVLSIPWTPTGRREQAFQPVHQRFDLGPGEQQLERPVGSVELNAAHGLAQPVDKAEFDFGGQDDNRLSGHEQFPSLGDGAPMMAERGGDASDCQSLGTPAPKGRAQ